MSEIVIAQDFKFFYKNVWIKRWSREKYFVGINCLPCNAVLFDNFSVSVLYALFNVAIEYAIFKVETRNYSRQPKESVK